MASFLSASTQFISTPKFTSTQSHKHQSAAPNSVSFRQSQRISASYSTTTDRPTTTISHTVSPAAASMYEILGIDMVASLQEIKAAYRRLARVSHPDVASRNDSSAADEFIKIHEAYTMLSDPDKRADYDRSLFRRRMTSPTVGASTTASRYSSYTTGRSWETDQCW